MEPQKLTTSVPSNQPLQPVQQQPVVIVNTAPSGQVNLQQSSHKRTLRHLAISELVLGISSIVLGAAIAGIVASGPFRYSSYFSYSGRIRYSYASGFTTGEGIWCGVWVVVAGALGVQSAKPLASRCMITSHMAFSIVAAVFCGTMTVIAGIGAGRAGNLQRFGVRSITPLLALYCVLCIFAFVLMILLILSASYSCAEIRCCSSNENQGCCGNGCEDCCNNCCMPYPGGNYGGQAVYFQQPGAPGQVYPQQQAFAAVQQGGMYSGPGQPMMIYPQQTQQPGGQGVVYVQQPATMQGVPSNLQQGHVFQAAQTACTTGATAPAPNTQVQTNPVAATNATEGQTQQIETAPIYQNVPPSYNQAPNQ